MHNHAIDVQPIAAALGAEVTGINLGQRLSEDTLKEIKHAFHD
tara:strand:- start:26 stop:154 length:129 start_codon:yes stop_codon:yes gene_type:complete